MSARTSGARKHRGGGGRVAADQRAQSIVVKRESSYIKLMLRHRRSERSRTSVYKQRVTIREVGFHKVLFVIAEKNVESTRERKRFGFSR